MPRNVHIATRVEAITLLTQPDAIMQQISMKIMNRREQLLEELMGTRVTFKKSSGELRNGIMERAETSCVIVRDGDVQHRVPIARLIL